MFDQYSLSSSTLFNSSMFAQIYDKKFGSGICVPASCNEDMIRLFANEQLNEYNLELATDYNQDLFCQLDDENSIFPLKPITIFAMWVNIINYQYPIIQSLLL